jgi:succinoglycan biosynthesis transport protein ExoP
MDNQQNAGLDMAALNNAPAGAKPDDASPFRRLVSMNNDEFDLQEVFRILWRRKSLIIATVVLLTAIAALVVLQITPLYTATVNVMIDTRQAKVTDIESVVSGMSGDMAAVYSEVEVLSSSSLIRRVVKKLNLTEDPEFNQNLRKKSWYDDLLNLETYLSHEFLVTTGLLREEGELSEEEAREALESQVVKAVTARLGIGQVRRSLVIGVSFTSSNARKAALLANTIADHYIVDQLEAKFEATKRASSWLNDRLGSLRDAVQRSEAAVEAYRQEISGKVGQGSKLTSQQISELNTQLILARTKKAEALARLDQVERLLASDGGLNTAAEVLNSPLVQRLREQEAQVIRKMSELESRYGPRHPQMIKVNAELRDLRLSIEREVKKIAQALKNESEVARARERSLEDSLRSLEAQGGQQNRAEIKLRELEREAQSNRALYENFLSRFKETREQEDLQQADARIISKADAPVVPSFPKKKLTLMVALVVSLFLGIALAFALERFDNSFRSADLVEQITGVPSVGMIPLAQGFLGQVRLSDFIKEKPTSAVAESMRGLRTSLLLSNVDNPPKVVGITSTVPSEGKSTAAMWLATVGAMSGQKVLLVDCDLRRPAVYKNFDIPNENSLVEVLANECEIQDAIHQIPSSNLYVLPAKSAQANALDLLSSDRMSQFMRFTRQHYDMVVLDCPPILAVSDTRVIGLLVDKMLYAIKWDSTPRGLVMTGLKAAAESKFNLAGTVLTQVNVRKHAKYGYGDYGYYYSKYKDYYTS